MKQQRERPVSLRWRGPSRDNRSAVDAARVLNLDTGGCGLTDSKSGLGGGAEWSAARFVLQSFCFGRGCAAGCLHVGAGGV